MAENSSRLNVLAGTANLISACKQENVTRLIYCSTVDVVIGHDEIIDGTEDNTAPPKKYLFPGYPESKYKAECLVLRANGTTTNNGKYKLIVLINTHNDINLLSMDELQHEEEEGSLFVLHNHLLK